MRNTNLILLFSFVLIIVLSSFIIRSQPEKDTLQKISSTQQSTNQLVSLLASAGGSSNCPAKTECCLKGSTLREGILFYCKLPRAPMYAVWGTCVYSCTVDDESCDNQDIDFTVGEGGSAPPNEPLPKIVVDTGSNGARYGSATFEGECPVVVQ